MSKPYWFDDLKTIGKMNKEETESILKELEGGEPAVRGARIGLRKPLGVWPFNDRAWKHTAHAFGYIAPAGPGSGLVPITHAGNISADTSLQNSRITVTLDRFRVADYPGIGMHQVLFDFYGQNQVAGSAENLHFNSAFRAMEGQGVAAINYPIFVGLNVGTMGVSFKCYTINVKNDVDEAFLKALESDVFKAGLKLTTVLQPAIAPFSEMAVNLTKTVASRNRNVPVQDFFMGLDFGTTATGARLAVGSYMAVQIPEESTAVWDWNDWVYDMSTGQIRSKQDKEKLIPYNYIVFGVNKYPG